MLHPRILSRVDGVFQMHPRSPPLEPRTDKELGFRVRLSLSFREVERSRGLSPRRSREIFRRIDGERNLEDGIAIARDSRGQID